MKTQDQIEAAMKAMAFYSSVKGANSVDDPAGFCGRDATVACVILSWVLDRLENTKVDDFLSQCVSVTDQVMAEIRNG